MPTSKTLHCVHGIPLNAGSSAWPIPNCPRLQSQAYPLIEKPQSAEENCHPSNQLNPITIPTAEWLWHFLCLINNFNPISAWVITFNTRILSTFTQTFLPSWQGSVEGGPRHPLLRLLVEPQTNPPPFVDALPQVVAYFLCQSDQEDSFGSTLSRAAFAAVNTRHAGLSIESMDESYNQQSIVYLVMMYLAPVPFVMAIRHSAVLPKKEEVPAALPPTGSCR